MTKKISLDLPEKNYKELSSLGKLFNKDVSHTILDILNAVSMESYSIENIQKESKGSRDLVSAVLSVLHAGRSAIDRIFNPILDKLGVKGHYILSDMEFDLDENYIWLNFTELRDSNLVIDEFGFFLESGVPSILASAHIETENINIEKLKKLIEEAEWPETEEYAEMDPFEASIINEDEEWATIQIKLSAEIVDDFPSIKALSNFVDKLLKKAKI